MTPSWVDPERYTALRDALEREFVAGIETTVPPPASVISDPLRDLGRAHELIKGMPPPPKEVRAGGEALERLRAQATRQRPEHGYPLGNLFGIPIRVDPTLPANMAFIDNADGPPTVLLFAPKPERRWWRRLLDRLARLVRRSP